MDWTLFPLVLLASILLVATVAMRRFGAQEQAESLRERHAARARGTDRARLQHPEIDLSRCIGCGSCVRACPEEDVLGLLHGQAVVLHGARCVGHGRCAAECPVGAIALTLGELQQRKDIPVLDAHGEAAGVPGLFLAGEITGFALIRTAVEHGREVAAEVARRIQAAPSNRREDVDDLCIVGAGPAGIACALEAKRRGLRFRVLEQETLGGTVAKYPRRKLVMTQPVSLPLVGRLTRDSYSKEELMELWQRIAIEHALPIETGHALQNLSRREDGTFELRTDRGIVMARHVCLALGRRGTPRKLGVAGEELAKVSYGLLDAESYRARRILVVGGGDSAVEAAVGLAVQPDNHVSLSYRKSNFTRLKARNERRLAEVLADGRLEVLHSSEVKEIREHEVLLEFGGDGASPGSRTLANDEVFVLAGGTPPFDLLSAAGVSFDHSARPAAPLAAGRGNGLAAAFGVGLLATLAALAWAWGFRDYYFAERIERPNLAQHSWLRSSRGFGLAAGVSATALLLGNLAYLLRRSPRFPLRFGALQKWMTAHVATGILALVAALLHGGFAMRDSVGGHALLGLAALVATGGVGRYLYSFVPHAANGRELALDELRSELAVLSEQWDRGDRAFGARVRDAMDELIAEGRTIGSLPGRIASLLGQQVSLRRTLQRLRTEGRAAGVPEDDLQRTLRLARRAHRAALMASRYEELRAILASWRFFHRWLALLIVLLLAVHVATALRFAEWNA